MVVLKPLKVTITNFPSDHLGSIEVPNFPANPEKGNHTVHLTPTVYIEEEDFREVCQKGWRSGGSVGGALAYRPC